MKHETFFRIKIKKKGRGNQYSFWQAAMKTWEMCRLFRKIFLKEHLKKAFILSLKIIPAGFMFH